MTALNEGKIDGYLEHFDPSSKRWLGGAATPLSLSDIGDGVVIATWAYGDLDQLVRQISPPQDTV